MKELTSEVQQQLLAPFQAAEVRIKTTPYIAAYTTARVVMTRLSEVLPWQWDFESVEWNMSGSILNVKGCLRIFQPDGPTLLFYDWGSAPPDVAKGQAKQFKHALSDAFKRCAVHVGVARYFYELQGVQAGRIPKGGLEKALAAVGYTGPWDDRHHGAVGGIREADQEDEDVEVPTHSSSATAPQEHSAPPATPANRTAPNVKINEEQKARIIAHVEAGGGSVNAPMFLGWLTKNTANNAVSLDDVLSEDVDELVRKLEELAAKAAKRKAAQ